MGPALSPAVRRTRSYTKEILLPHLAGQVSGGLFLALAAGGLGSLLRLVFPAEPLEMAVAAVIAVYALSNVLPIPLWRPASSHQVPEDFLRTPYVRATAFLWGVGLGVGWFTRQVTTAFLTLCAAMLVLPPNATLLAAVTFALARGLTILLGLGAPDLHAIERRFDAVRSHTLVPLLTSALTGILLVLVVVPGTFE